MNPTIIDTGKELERLEGVIRKNLAAFYEVGQALMAIRDKRLYLCKNGGKYQTFEAYCRGIWDMGKSNAYYLISASEVEKNLSTMVDKPATERQARPLSKLEPEQQRQAWQKAVETAPEGKVTAAHVARVVKGMTEPEGEKGGDDRKNERTIIKESERKEYEEIVNTPVGLLKLKVAWREAKKEEKREFLNWIDQRREIDGI